MADANKKITFNDKAGKRLVLGKPGVWEADRPMSSMEAQMRNIMYPAPYKVPGPIRLKTSS
jgi:hypothetical protein